MASSNDLNPIQDLWLRLNGLVAATGMVDAAIHSDLETYAPVLQGWYQKLAEIAKYCDKMVEEVQEFGSFYDEMNEDSFDDGESED